MKDSKNSWTVVLHEQVQQSIIRDKPPATNISAPNRISTLDPAAVALAPFSTSSPDKDACLTNDTSYNHSVKKKFGDCELSDILP